MRWLDVLRGMYVKAPAPVKAVASRLIGLFPQNAVYGKSYRRWHEDILRSRDDPDFTEMRVRSELEEVLAHAMAAPFYAESVTTDEVADPFARLKAFPVLTKEEVRENAPQMASVPLESLDLVTTSGSSGRPLQVWLDRARGAREQAFIHAAWAAAGFRLGDARLVLRGVQIQNVDKRPVEWDAALRELRCSPFHLTDLFMADYVAQAEKRGISYIHGYPSAIAILARYIKRVEHPWRLKVKGIFPISEPLLGEQVALFGEVFSDASVLPFYGMTEKVTFARTSVGDPSVYEFEPLYGWAELLDRNGQPVTEPGQIGRLVSTGFTTKGLPLVRYDTGDDAELVALPSRENAWRLSVTNLQGRWRPEYLVSKEGALISIAALNVHSSNYLALSEFLFVQSEPGSVTLHAVPAPGADAASIEAYLDEVRKKVGAGIQFDLELRDAIDPGARGKRQYFKQELDLAPYFD